MGTGGDYAGGRFRDFNVNASWRPTSSIRVEVGPSYGFNRDRSMYVTTEADPAATATFGNRYVFASCGTFAQATVWRALDVAQGQVWEAVLSQLDMGRTSLAIAPSNPSVIYALASFYHLPAASPNDYGLRAGVLKHYGLDELPKKAALTELAEPWRPFRSIATWFIWRSLGGVPQST